MDATNATLKGLTLVMPNRSIDIYNPKSFLQGSLNSSLGNIESIFPVDMLSGIQSFIVISRCLAASVPVNTYNRIWLGSMLGTLIISMEWQ